MISGIRVSASDVVIQKDDLTSKQGLGLKQNHVVSAKVINLLPGGKAVLEVDGQLLTARTGVLLKPGEQLTLKVAQTADEIVLRLMAPGSQKGGGHLSSLVRFLSEKMPIPDIQKNRLPSAGHLLNRLAIKSAKADYHFLPRLLEEGGLMLETKLSGAVQQKGTGQGFNAMVNQLLQHDLKGAFFSDLATAGKDPAVMKMIRTTIDAIENFQQLNHQSSETGRIILPIPVLSESAFRFGQLLMDLGTEQHQQKEDGGRVVHISFLLEMSNLGPLRADFSILKKAITGVFLLSDKDTCDYVRSALPDLKKRLASIDFTVQKIDCKTVAPHFMEQHNFLETLLAEQDSGMLNIVV